MAMLDSCPNTLRLPRDRPAPHPEGRALMALAAVDPLHS